MRKRFVILIAALIVLAVSHLNAKSLIISGEINNDSALQIVSLILYYDTLPNESVITIYIDSPGGEITAAYMIADTIEACKKPVETIVMSKAYSAAVMIVSITGTKGLRYAYKHAQFLIHEPYIIIKDRAFHDKDAIEFLKTTKQVKDELIEWIYKHTNINKIDIKRFVNGEYIFDAKTARKLGVIDQIIDHQNNPNRKYDKKIGEE